jgi:hypothetical protein
MITTTKHIRSSVATLLAATLRQGNHDRNHKLRDIVVIDLGP